MDQERLYWSNEAQKVLFSIDKGAGQNGEQVEPTLETQGDVGNLLIYGEHVQPLPGEYPEISAATSTVLYPHILFIDPSCLLVTKYMKKPDFHGHTNTSLQLLLAPWHQTTPLCEGVTHPTVKYSLHYRELFDNATDRISCDKVPCKKKVISFRILSDSPYIAWPQFHFLQETYNRTVTIDGLKPYTNYRIQVQASNYYTDLRNMETPLGEILIGQTKEGGRLIGGTTWL